MGLRKVWNDAMRQFNQLVFDIECDEMRAHKFLRNHGEEHGLVLPDNFFDEYRENTRRTLKLAEQLGVPMPKDV